ncbi:hypothetical protein GcC1_176021 [Golovinomyces cichoracearum]|uniref:Uncharacterized protein n=1 Tax=Golovinomyces cichoracearum TaxID=62708 RepID=A0A420HP77_9PEZI|nr:hypothetical protein GcC1_176021 [Golovinomyces cichoracearum]
MLQTMRDLTFKRNTITLSYKETGMHPLDPHIVLTRKEIFDAPVRPSTPPPNEEIDWAACLTPQARLPQIEKYTNYITRRLEADQNDESPYTPTAARVIKRRDKAMYKLLYDGSLATEELTKKHRLALDTQARKKANRVVQNFGVIYVGDGRLRMLERDADDSKRELEALIRKKNGKQTVVEKKKKRVDNAREKHRKEATLAIEKQHKQKLDIHLKHIREMWQRFGYQ